MRTTLFSLTALVILALSPGCGGPPKLTLKGTINGAYLTVKKGTEVFGEFSFTTSNMEGNWSARSCPFACQRIYTVVREFKMNKVD